MKINLQIALRSALQCLAIAAALGASALASAQNPLIRNQFTADPTARVFDGRVYLYPSHDIPSPVERLKEWFCMEDYHVFSSENLIDWTDHGMILSQKTVPWVDGESYSMWAPECVEKNGMYYFYFPAGPKEERGFRVGVAVARSPEGPFMPMRRPIEGIMGIDPCVLVDDDGRSYIYWSGMGIRGAELDESMMRLKGEPVQISGLPEGFKEGPYVFKREGKYYCTFPWVRKNTETLAYAMGDSPLGPFEYKGLIMEEWPDSCWTNHHSIIEYKGDWLLFYHHNDCSPEFDKNRSARADYIHFNPDGTIQTVRPTLRGVGVADARSHLHIDRYSDISPKGASAELIDPSDGFGGWKCVFTKPGAWITYDRVDFGSRPVSSVTARVRAPKGGKLEIHAGKPDGSSRIATVPVRPSADWQTVSVPLSSASPEGIRDIAASLSKGNLMEVDWIGFDALPWNEGGFATGKYRNLFSELGHSSAEVDKKLQDIFDSLFFGKDKIYFEVGDDMAYVSDIKNNDVRTEGMSYGMMAAVQMDRKDIFDRLWRWSKKHMQHQEGDLAGYFAWSCKTDGTPNAHGPASDGELYFITSLIFASNRWGNDTGIDYLAEARHIVDSSMLKAGKDNSAPLINMEHRLITFTPDSWGGRYTDPSYHVPAFYEVWAEWLGDGRSQFWRDCAAKSREYLHRCVHPETGLTPDYSNYDGSPLGQRRMFGDAFRFDSWRVPMNVALDYSWACADRDWQRAYADRIQDFLYSKGIDDFMDQYNPDGSDVETIAEAGGYRALRHSLGLVSTAASASLAATDIKSREFAERLWDSRHEPYKDGYFDAYYDGFLRLFSFMHLAGRYRVITPRS